MKKDNIQILDGKELAFFGAITASISHEINNILSIINEYSGLLEDLVLANEQGKPVEGDRIRKIALNISKQINREKDVINLMNRFAHGVDKPIVKFNLGEVVSDITCLSQRFADLKKVSLDITLPGEQITLVSSPFGVQHIIFLCLKLALEFPISKDNISITLEKENSEAIINIASPRIEKNSDTEEKMCVITCLINNLGGKIITKETSDTRYLYKLCLPLLMPDVEKENKEDPSSEC